jgi:OCT family organic cation transporter-like MFS transporter 4/5
MAATFSSLSDDLHSPILAPAPPSKNTTETEKICIDDMFEKYCGEFGKWQLKHFILTCLAWALEAFHTMVMIFADREPDWRCVNGAECGGRSVCGMKAGEWEWIGGKSASTVSEWNLICGDKFKVGLVQAVFFAGCMIG